MSRSEVASVEASRLQHRQWGHKGRSRINRTRNPSTNPNPNGPTPPPTHITFPIPHRATPLPPPPPLLPPPPEPPPTHSTQPGSQVYQHEEDELSCHSMPPTDKRTVTPAPLVGTQRTLLTPPQRQAAMSPSALFPTPLLHPMGNRRSHHHLPNPLQRHRAQARPPPIPIFLHLPTQSPPSTSTQSSSNTSQKSANDTGWQTSRN